VVLVLPDLHEVARRSRREPQRGRLREGSIVEGNLQAFESESKLNDFRYGCLHARRARVGLVEHRADHQRHGSSRYFLARRGHVLKARAAVRGAVVEVLVYFRNGIEYLKEIHGSQEAEGKTSTLLDNVVGERRSGLDV